MCYWQHEVSIPSVGMVLHKLWRELVSRHIFDYRSLICFIPPVLNFNNMFNFASDNYIKITYTCIALQINAYMVDDKDMFWCLIKPGIKIIFRNTLREMYDWQLHTKHLVGHLSAFARYYHSWSCLAATRIFMAHSRGWPSRGQTRQRQDKTD